MCKAKSSKGSLAKKLCREYSGSEEKIWNGSHRNEEKKSSENESLAHTSVWG